ncbi:MAG: DUF6883 domain-containing protein [Chloroflexota bacterium]
MKLPNHERAVLDIDKLINYNLNNEHPRGKHKAKVFAAALGLTQDDASELQSALLAAATSYEATATEGDEYGQRYVLDFSMSTPAGSAIVRSA